MAARLRSAGLGHQLTKEPRIHHLLKEMAHRCKWNDNARNSKAAFADIARLATTECEKLYILQHKYKEWIFLVGQYIFQIL